MRKGDGSIQTSVESLEIKNLSEYEQKIDTEDQDFTIIPLKPLPDSNSDSSPLPVTPSVTNTSEIDEPPQPKTPPLEEGLSDQNKLSRLTKNRRHYPTLWYTGIEDIPRLLKFRSVELWFDDEQTIIAFPDGWQSPRRFVLNEIEFVAQS